MTLSALFFYLFSGIMIASAVMVIGARNPVHSVLFLILAQLRNLGAEMAEHGLETRIERLGETRG